MKIRKLVIRDVVGRHSTFAAITSVVLFVMGSTWLAYLVSFLILLEVALIFVAILSMFAWPWVLAGFWQTILIAVASPWVRILAVGVLILASFLLYLARTYMRPIYGLTEIMVGVTSCWVGLSDPRPNVLSASLAIIGGIYIFIRGFDNLIDEQSLLAPSKQASRIAQGSTEPTKTSDARIERQRSDNTQATTLEKRMVKTPPHSEQKS
jgi:hypothetical protein